MNKETALLLGFLDGEREHVLGILQGSLPPFGVRVPPAPSIGACVPPALNAPAPAFGHVPQPEWAYWRRRRQRSP